MTGTRATAAVSILMFGGFIVAMVTAQETPARPGEAQSVLRRSGGAARGSIGDQDDARTVVGESAATRPSLVDRLQRIRRNATTSDSQSAESSQNAGSGSQLASPGSSTADGQLGRMHSEQGQAANQPVRGHGLPSVLRQNTPAASSIWDAAGSGQTVHDARQPVHLNTPAAAQPIVGAESRRPSAVLDSSPADKTPAYGAARAGQPADSASQPALLSKSGSSLRIEAFGPEAVMINQEAVYSLTLSNQSTFGAEGVFVRVVVPGWVEVSTADASLGTTQLRTSDPGGKQLIWSADQLSAGGRETLKMTVIPRENRPFQLAVDWTQRPAASVAEVFVQQPKLEMAVYGPREMQYGETAVYTIQLTNPGTGPADHVIVDFVYGSERLPSKQIGRLAAGEQTEIRVELTARQAGALRVAAAAAAESGLRAEAVEEVLVRRAKLELEVVGAPVKFSGSVATYRIRVRNTGDAAATDVSAELLLPGGAAYVPRDQDIRVNGNRLARALGTIAPGSERTFQIACQLNAAGDNVLQAVASGSMELSASDAFTTQVKALADLKLVVNDPQGPVAVGDKALYELTVVNRGTKAARDVRVVAQFSEGIEPVEAVGATARTVPGQVLFHPIPKIEPGEQVQLKITARADESGNHRFRAEVNCAEPADTVLVAEESTYFFADDLETAARSADRRE